MELKISSHDSMDSRQSQSIIKPVFDKASTSFIFWAVDIGPGSIWNPSRGPSSKISTKFGKSEIKQPP